MKAVFVDTAGWMACADAADPAHRRASAARDAALENGQAFVTTDYVVDETLALIRFRLGLAAADAWWRQIDSSSRLRWERISVERFDKARAVLPFPRQRFFVHRLQQLRRHAGAPAEAGADDGPALPSDGIPDVAGLPPVIGQRRPLPI